MFFTKKEADKIAAKNFWLWFAENEAHISAELANHNADIVWEIDKELKPVFPYCKKDLEFQLGHDENGMGEFTFFHMGNRHLKRDGMMLGEMMPKVLADRWQFVIEK